MLSPLYVLSPRFASGHQRGIRLLQFLPAALLLLLTACRSPEEAPATVSGTEGAAPGEHFILYAPTQSTETYLVDSSNNVAHQWSSKYDAGQSAFLLEDGSILRPGSINEVVPDNRFVAAYRDGHNTIFQIGGILERIAKNNEVVWSFQYYGDDYAPHHVATVMPNGNLLMPVWRYFSKDQSLALGRDRKHLTSGGLWLDSLVEIRPTGTNGGEVVWEWRSSDHLIQDFDSKKAGYGKPAGHPERIDVNYGKGLNVPEDIMHVNSAYYMQDLDEIVVTSYHYSELWVIDHSTTTAEAAGTKGGRRGHGGDLLYRWGNPWAYGQTGTKAFLLSAVHDPKWLPKERHFIMFDNNTADHSRDLDGGNSMMVEMEPPISPDGSFALGADGVYGPPQPIHAYDLGVQASSVGTAQRLADGGTLSCDCPKSNAIWLDAKGSIVSTQALYTNTTKNADLTQVFRLVSYPKDDPGVQSAMHP